MAKQPVLNGADLVDRVIAEGTDDIVSDPTPLAPAALAKLTFAGKQKLSPAIAKWLAYDASLVDWFDSYDKPKFKAQKLGALAKSVYEHDFGYKNLESALPGDCYLLPGGSDSCRFLYVADDGVDSAGEYPVLLLDTDDVPYIGVEYPGLDVYLATDTGVVKGADEYGGMIKDKAYGARMQEHADRLFAGNAGVEMDQWMEVFGLEDMEVDED